MFSTRIISFLASVLIFFTPFTSTTPLLLSSEVTLNGYGSLTVLAKGSEVGCLASNWKMVVEPAHCGNFSVGPKPGWNRYYNINSTLGVCGYKYHFNATNLNENAIFVLDCGVEGYQDYLQFWPGVNEHANWAVMVVAGNRNFTTIDERMPLGTEALNVSTDSFMYSPQNFQVGWKEAI